MLQQTAFTSIIVSLLFLFIYLFIYFIFDFEFEQNDVYSRSI